MRELIRSDDLLDSDDWDGKDIRIYLSRDGGYPVLTPLPC